MSEPQHPVESSAFDAPSAPRERSLAEHLVVLGTPSLEGSGLLEGFSPTAGLDEVCLGLEALGGPSAETLRVNALWMLGSRVLDEYVNAAWATEHIAKLHGRLGAWAALSCARLAFARSHDDDAPTRTLLEAAEAFVAGSASQETVARARESITRRHRGCPRSVVSWAAGAVIIKSLGGFCGAARDACDALTDLTLSRPAAGTGMAPSAAYDAHHASANRRLVAEIADRLALFPAWAGDPAADPWPMPKGGRL